MKDRAKRLTITLSCFVMVLFVYGFLTLGAESRATISDTERALATIQVQNTFSKHAYYHTAGGCEEMARGRRLERRTLNVQRRMKNERINSQRHKV